MELTNSYSQFFTNIKVSIKKLKRIGRKRAAIEKGIERPKKVMAKKPLMGLSLGAH